MVRNIPLQSLPLLFQRKDYVAESVGLFKEFQAEKEEKK